MPKLLPEPFKECPRFFHCSVNCCPLDYKMRKRPSLPADRERHCKANRETRLAIATKYPYLPTGGLTDKEIARDKRRAAAKARWDALPVEEQQRRLSSRFKPSEQGPS